MSKLYACGENKYYQYGSSQTAYPIVAGVNVSTNALKDKVIKDITCGINYGFVITDAGELYGFGDNTNSNLGFETVLPNPKDTVLPNQIIYIDIDSGNPVIWKSVFANNNSFLYFTFFIDNTNKLYAAGNNANGNLSIETISDKNVLSVCKYSDNNEVFCKNITCNDYYSVIINNKNEVYWCGTTPTKTEQFFKKINFLDPSPFSTIKQVSINSKQNTYLYLLTDIDIDTGGGGDVYKVNVADAFTNSNIGNYTKLTFGELNEKVVKLSICDDNLAALTVDGNIYVWGIYGYGHGFIPPDNFFIQTYPADPTKIKPEGNPDSKFIDVIAGNLDSLALTLNGEIYSCSSKSPIGNVNNKTNFFNPIFSNGLLPFDIHTSKIALGLNTFLAISDPNAACFNEGVKILCLNCKLNGELNEIYRPVQDLQVGDFVKSYLHGYRKVNKILTGSFVNNPTDQGVPNCMYMMVKTEDNQLIDDLILTRNHGILVEKLSENEEKKIDKNTLPIIDNLLSIITADSDKFEKVMDNNVYKYYHFSLETDGDNDRRFAVYANGLLVEIPSINMMNNALNIKPLDF